MKKTSNLPKVKIGASVVCIGRQGSGKTPLCKRLAENSKFKNLVVYDPNKEYDPNKYTIFYSLEKFKAFLTSEKSKNCFIICEIGRAHV